MKAVVGVVGSDTIAAVENARKLGRLLAEEGWVMLSGGRDSGVMKAVSEGATQVPGSLTIGVLPTAGAKVAPDVDVAIITDIGNARNNIIGLSSCAVIACGVDGPGTASEVALAMKNQKPVILLGASSAAAEFFRELDAQSKIYLANTPDEAIRIIKQNALCGRQPA